MSEVSGTERINRVHFFVGAIVIVMIAFSGCLEIFGDDYGSSGSGSSLYSSGSCRDGYAKYSTSGDHCCKEGYPYYYNNSCNKCREGYYSYSTSAGYCCKAGYPYYYNGTCNKCREGYHTYTTSAGYCCPSGYYYYYDGACHTKASTSGTTTVYRTTTYDATTGCAQGSNYQCSQWIAYGSCQVQSCTCYYSGASGDTFRAFYHTSDGAYFVCSGEGQSLSCLSAATGAANHCA